MLKKYKKFIFNSLLVIVIFCNFLFVAPPLNASGTKADWEDQLDRAGSQAWGAAPEQTGLASIIQIVISAFLSLLGIIFIVLIIYSGFNWMTARGDEEKVALAKNTLTRAVIGLIIIIAAYAITYFVFINLPRGAGGGDRFTTGP